MRILNLIQCTNLGGMEQSSLRLMQALKRRGHDCRVLSLNPIGALGPLLEDAGIPASGLTYSGKGGWRSYPTLYRHLRNSDAEALIMTGHNLLAMMALGGLCRGRRLLAMHFHHVGVMPKWQWRLFYQLAERRFLTISYPSDFVREEAISIYPSIESRAVTIRNPIQLPPTTTPEDRYDSRQKLGLPTDVPLVGNAGWLIHRKRFDVFLQTAARLAAKLPDVQFVIAGDGPERKALVSLAERLGLRDKIHWLGWLKDLHGFYRGLDALLFNSDWDAFPTTPLEAMSHGIPVVASVLNGGLREVISDARFGYLLREHNPELLANAVLTALPPEGHTMALRGRGRVAKLADPLAIAVQIEAILEDRCETIEFGSPLYGDPP